MATNSSNSDPLVVFQQELAQGRQPVEEGDEIVFAHLNARFNKSTPTSFKTQSGGTYDFGAIVFFYKHRSAPISEYLRASRSNKVASIKYFDRKSLLAFLHGSGEVDAAGKRGLAAGTDESAGDSAAKKRKLSASAAGKTGKDSISRTSSSKHSSSAEAHTSSFNISSAFPEGSAAYRVFSREYTPVSRTKMLLAVRSLAEVSAIEKLAKIDAAAVAVSPAAGKTKSANGSSQARSSAASRTAAAVTNGSTDKKEEGRQRWMPIIIVPAAASSTITIRNVVKFLGEGVYVSPQDLPRPANGAAVPSEVTLTHKHAFGEVTYRVIDSTRKLEKRHWGRVVGVFAQGQAWQFKGWQWSTPAEVFGNCAGFYMYFDDNKIPDAVSSWNVMKFPLKRQHRHLDGIYAYKMWEAIENFVAKRKTPLIR